MFDDRTSFRAKELPRKFPNRNFTSVFADQTSFRAKGLRPTLENCNFTSVFADGTSFRAKKVAPDASKSQCYISFCQSNRNPTSFRAKGLRATLENCNFFCRSNFISGKSVATEVSKSQFYISFCRSNFFFLAKTLRPTLENRNVTSVLPIESPFVRKGCAGRFKIAILLEFLKIEPHFVQKGCILWRLVAIAPPP